MSVEDWQASRRRQFGREQAFVLERLGAEPEFVVQPEEQEPLSRRDARHGAGRQLLLVPRKKQRCASCVLEQRIGRVYRLGQRKSVQVVNFVAQGSIEEGMLSVLAFKKSLFAGVLDGGESEVLMQGTRLAKFMEAVDEVTGAMGAAEPAQALPSDPPPAGDVEPAPEEPAAPDPWAALLDAGLELVEALARRGGADSGELLATIERDPRTGRDVLRLPLPQPQTVQRLADALGGLLAGLRRESKP
jgi:hypothetical protein